ncbi:hypothetical protein L211DRAFT_634397 [Terfezia boudieri ATCC MYA-4762]|uniref:Uncharacterized protein n=1 Tax=Terfezia boudieri ATCC MYA-4762 TaxID=1051890 RepID=A0A3N4LCG2_9PEZI|nr:hypothetical protein L211DRAFT_634397 [Terfezia boudieri ATCC MYA-4762]
MLEIIQVTMTAEWMLRVEGSPADKTSSQLHWLQGLAPEEDVWLSLRRPLLQTSLLSKQELLAFSVKMGIDENVVTTIHSSPPPNPRHSTPPGPVSPSSEEQNAVELPADVAPTSLIKPSKPSTGNYYEDVDPRFAERSQDVDLGNSVTTDEGMPAMLIPGYNPQIGSSRPPQSKSPVQFNKQNYGRPQNNPNSEHGYPYAPQNSDQQYVPYVHGRPPFPEYDAPPQSPAYSEQTNFTSISQRPVNPRWQQPPGQQPLGRGPPRNMPLLSGNPDFELPTLSQGRGGPRGRIPGAVPPGLGPDRRGRYPPTTSKYA